MSSTRHKSNATGPQPGDAAPVPADPNADPTDAPTAEAQAQEEKTVESDLAALTDRLLRLQADFDNYRKRVQRDQADTYRRSLKSLMSDLLPALDHFEMGLKNAAEMKVPDTFSQGFAMVFEQLKSVLAQYGLVPVDAVGTPFDPMLHESVSAVPSDSPRDTVVEQIRRGYRLGDQMIRPAQVILSFGSAESEKTDPKPDA